MKLAPKQDLEERIKDIRREAEKLVLLRAEELKKGSGLPIEVLLQMLQAGKCRCTAALTYLKHSVRIPPLQTDNPSPPEPPKGILWILDDADEYELHQRLIDAAEKGKLYVPPVATLH